MSSQIDSTCGLGKQILLRKFPPSNCEEEYSDPKMARGPKWSFESVSEPMVGDINIAAIGGAVPQ
jgi:hypothetical protein